MERTESVVIQVAPDYENEKIQEMQGFGWNLQGRQEMHQEGDAYGRPSYGDSSTYVIKTKVSHYVKLHFARSTNLPNLSQIKELESRYSNLSFKKPPGIAVPAVFAILCGLGIFSSFSFGRVDGSTVIAAIVYLILTALCVRWVLSRQRRRQEAQSHNQASLEEMAEIRTEAGALLQAG